MLNLSIVLLVLYDPRKSPCLGYLIPKPYFTLPVQALVSLYHIWSSATLCYGVNLAVNVMIVYSFFIPYILGKELRVGRPHICYKASNQIRNPCNLRVVFRSFQLVHANMFCFAGLFLVLINAGDMVTAIYIIFVLVNYGSTLNFYTKVPLLIIVLYIMFLWSAVLEFGKMYHVSCKKVFSSWKRYDWGSAKERKIMAKFRLSCRPILMSYGKEFVIGPLSVLNFSKGVIRGTMRALLSTKQ